MSLVRKAGGDRLPQSVEEDRWPTVDVFITYCGEGEDTLVNSLKAACALSYPSQQFRVIVLDDSHSDELRDKIITLSKTEGLRNLHYASRKVVVKTHSKASNMNFGLQYVASLDQGASEYVAGLDVDMIAEPNWLRRVLPHLHNNPRAGVVSIRQRFYNLLRRDPLGLRLELLPIGALICLQDYTNNANFTGTGFVARRSALETIGGFAEDCLSEDALTSFYLSAAGWDLIFVPEPLQWGIAPDTFPAHLKQSQRWFIGMFSLMHFIQKSKARTVRPDMRKSILLWGYIAGYSSFAWTFTLIAMPLIVLVGSAQRLVLVESARHLRVLIQIASLDFAAQSLYNICMSSLVEFRMPFSSSTLSIWTQPWRLSILLRYYLVPKLFGNGVPTFTPTGVPAGSDAAEYAARRNRSRVECAKIVFWDCSAYLHFIVFLLCVAGGGMWVHKLLQAFNSREAFQSVPLTLLHGLACPPILLLWATVASSAWIPVAHALRPSPVLEKHEALAHDPNTGVNYPSPRAKREHSGRPNQRSFILKCIIYLAALLISGTI